jgi:long chain fatty acid CoA FadD26
MVKRTEPQANRQEDYAAPRAAIRRANPSSSTCEGEGEAIAMTQPSLPALLRERAGQRPDARAYTFIDHDIDPAGFAESLTWAQLYQGALAVAEELRLCGQVGDRAAILAPEGLGYITAFLGVLHAGFVAVPLPVPQFRVHDERVSAALRDCSPSVILTTSTVVDEVSKYASVENGCVGTSVIEVDSLDLYSARVSDAVGQPHPRAAYLQYTSGSTRTPAGVIVSHRNVIANLEQATAIYLEGIGSTPPPGLRCVSWLPFHHDMGLFFTVFMTLYTGAPMSFITPVAFLQRPARWMQLLGEADLSYSCAPNFAFDLAARRTSDHDMNGIDLAGVRAIINGSERVQPTTVKRFNERFARYNLKETAILPSYGLAEATLCVAAPKLGQPVRTVRFASEQLSDGYVTACTNGDSGATDLVSYGPHRVTPGMCAVRIVNPDTQRENPPETIGEIWVHGDNVAMGYWQKSMESRRTFGAKIVDPSPGTPNGSWLRTGDLGAMFDGELFIMGRIKDVLIIDGRNHYPDDIEATIREITGGRVAAISVPDDCTERLVAIAELTTEHTRSREEQTPKLRAIRREIISAISTAHGLRVSDLVVVPPGSIPFTTSGKVRRAACVQRYRHDEFKRLDVSASLLDEAW